MTFIQQFFERPTRHGQIRIYMLSKLTNVLRMIDGWSGPMLSSMRVSMYTLQLLDRRKICISTKDANLETMVPHSPSTWTVSATIKIEFLNNLPRTQLAGRISSDQLNNAWKYAFANPYSISHVLFLSFNSYSTSCSHVSRIGEFIVLRNIHRQILYFAIRMPVLEPVVPHGLHRQTLIPKG